MIGWLADWKPKGCGAVAKSVNTEKKTSIHCGTGFLFSRGHLHCLKSFAFIRFFVRHRTLRLIAFVIACRLIFRIIGNSHKCRLF